MRDLLRDRPFAGQLLTGGLGFAAMFAYIAGSSFTLQRIYGASAQTYSLLFALDSIGLVGTGQLNGKLLLGRFPPHRVPATGLAVLCLAGTALLPLVTVTHAGLARIALALFLTACPVGMILPTTTALSLQRAPHAAGSASALPMAVAVHRGSAGPLSRRTENTSARNLGEPGSATGIHPLLGGIHRPLHSPQNSPPIPPHDKVGGHPGNLRNPCVTRPISRQEANGHTIRSECPRDARAAHATVTATLRPA